MGHYFEASLCLSAQTFLSQQRMIELYICVTDCLYTDDLIWNLDFLVKVLNYLIVDVLKQ